MWNYSVLTSKHSAVAGYKHRDATPTGTCFSKAMKKHHTSLKHSHCQVCLFEKGINFPKGDSLFLLLKHKRYCNSSALFGLGHAPLIVGNAWK